MLCSFPCLAGLLALVALPVEVVCLVAVASLHVLGYSLLVYFVLIRPIKRNGQPRSTRHHFQSSAAPSRWWTTLQSRLKSCNCWGYLLLLVAALLELLVILLLWGHLGHAVNIPQPAPQPAGNALHAEP